MTSESLSRRRWPGVAAGVGGLLAGSTLCGMTLGVNAHLRGAAVDIAVLWAWLTLPAVAVLVAAAACGSAAAAWWSALRRPAPEAGRRDRRGAVLRSFLVGAPPALVLALPDIGLSGRRVADALLGGRAQDHLVLAIVLTAFVLLGALGGRLLLRVLPPTRGARAAATALACVALLTGSCARVESHRGRATEAASPSPDRAAESSLADGNAPPVADRVVLLNIDGLDPGVLEELGAELPFLASMRRDGVYAHLQTETPTLSPAIWTTMVTGVPRREHGIRGFLWFDLPGMTRPVLEFPLNSGLNFRLLPWLDRTVAGGRLARQFRSDQRLAPAIWEIAEGVGPIGVHRWRVTWPAEPLDGFVLGEGVSQVVEEFRPPRAPLPGSLVPEDVLEGLSGQTPGQPVDVTGRLAELIERYDTRLTVAGLPSVDGVQHEWGLDWKLAGSQGRSRIIARYRVQDRRLAELHRRLGPDTDFIVVSDHGFSFEHGHHALAPPGVFLATGPSFPEGRRVEGLSIYDLVPLVADLLALPQSAELPGFRRGVYPGALLAVRSTRVVPAYPRRSVAASEDVPDEDLEAVKERLRGLGYIE